MTKAFCLSFSPSSRGWSDFDIDDAERSVVVVLSARCCWGICTVRGEKGSSCGLSLALDAKVFEREEGCDNAVVHLAGEKIAFGYLSDEVSCCQWLQRTQRERENTKSISQNLFWSRLAAAQSGCALVVRGKKRSRSCY